MSFTIYTLIIDGYFQFIFGKNIFGYETVRSDRLSSLFFDELILGSYLGKILPIFCTFCLFNRKYINKYYEYGIEVDRMISKYFSLQNRGSLRSGYFESTISSLRERETRGWWNEFRFQLNVNNNTNLDISLLNGFDKGKQQGKEFIARAKGIKANGKLLFSRTGRFQTEVTIVNVEEEKESSYLPPEVLKSFPVGLSIRTNTQFQYLFNRSLSLIFNFGTINDQRYNKNYNKHKLLQ